MRRTTRIVLAFGLAALLVTGGAHADGPGGSSEHHAECTDPETGETSVGEPGTTAEDCPEGTEGRTVYTNDVTCGDNRNAAGLDVFIGPEGIEACNDDADAPLQGRVMVSGDAGYGGADGDKDNLFPLDGWIGVSSEAGFLVACGYRGEEGNLSLDHANEFDSPAYCV